MTFCVCLCSVKCADKYVFSPNKHTCVQRSQNVVEITSKRGEEVSKDAERIRDFDKPFDSSAINIFAPVYFVVLRLWSNCNIDKTLSKSISISFYALELLRNSSKVHDFTVQSDSVAHGRR